MPVFTFDARSAAGRPQSGREEAISAAALAGNLKARGYMVISVRSDESSARGFSLNPVHWLPPRSMDIEVGLQQVAVMLRSGLTLLTALRTAAEHARQRRRVATLWDSLADHIQGGGSLADAMEASPRFPHLAVQLARVGEQTGTLDSVLARAAEAMERKRLLLTQLGTALFYPTVVLMAAFGVAGFMVFYLIPRLQVFLSALGRKLPPLTQLLVDIATFFQTYGQPVGIGVVVLTGAMIAIYLWPPGRMFFDRLALRLPIIGYLLRLAATAQFAHALGILLNSGVTLVEGLRTVGDLFRNQFLAGIVKQSRETVLGGGTLATPLLTPGGFMPMLSRMAGVGEASGTLDELLAEVARFHESQLQGAIRRFSVIIEPVIIVVVGGIVGFVYIAFFMALFSVASSGGAR
jgi:type IV pilus assembly protein PilC